MSARDFDDVGGDLVHEGEVIDLERRRFRFHDGKQVERDVVRHPGGVAIVAHDGECVLLVRQPRPAVGEPDLLEIPAGRLDVDGEPVADAARRELAEELGLGARHWQRLTSFYTSPDVLRQEVHLFLATGLFEHREDSGEDERIEPVRWPLDDLDGAIAQNRDAKTLVGLLMLRSALAAA